MNESDASWKRATAALGRCALTCLLLPLWLVLGLVGVVLVKPATWIIDLADMIGARLAKLWGLA